MRNQRGLTLIEALISIVIISMVAVSALFLMSDVKKNSAEIEQKAKMVELAADVELNLQNSCAQANTMAQTAFNCMLNPATCPASNALSILDKNNSAVNLQTVATNSGMNLTMTWSPNCIGTCSKGSVRVDYTITNTNSTFNMRPLSYSVLMDYIPGGRRNCRDIQLAQPGAPDGYYYIDPDGAGGNCGFYAYCKGDWTLVANAPADGYASLPEVNRLGLSDFGTVPMNQFTKLFSILTSPGWSNVKVEVNGNTSMEFEASPSGAASHVTQGFDSTTMTNTGGSASSAAADWQFELQHPANYNFGFAHNSCPSSLCYTNGSGYIGFASQYFGASPTYFSGSFIRVRGSLWFK